MKISKEIAEKYDIWLLSNYNLIGESKQQISYIERIVNFIYSETKEDIKVFNYLTENQKSIYDKLEKNVDSFEVKNSHELEQIRLAFTYFIEFLNKDSLVQ